MFQGVSAVVGQLAHFFTRTMFFRLHRGRFLRKSDVGGPEGAQLEAAT